MCPVVNFYFYFYYVGGEGRTVDERTELVGQLAGPLEGADERLDEAERGAHGGGGERLGEEVLLHRVLGLGRWGRDRVVSVREGHEVVAEMVGRARWGRGRRGGRGEGGRGGEGGWGRECVRVELTFGDGRVEERAAGETEEEDAEERSVQTWASNVELEKK